MQVNPLERRGPVCPEDEEARDPEEVHHEDRRHAEQHPHPTRTPGGRKREHRGQVDRRRQEPVARVDHEDLEAVEPEAGTLLQRHGAEGSEATRRATRRQSGASSQRSAVSVARPTWNRATQARKNAVNRR